MNDTPRAPEVVIIILNWNGIPDTLDCLASLQHVTYPSYELVVVDNGSVDGSVSAIRAAFPDVKIIETGQNLGFAGGNNVGLEYARQAGAEYALLLNNDTEVDAKFLDDLVRAAESNPDAGIAGPSIYYYSAPRTFWSAGGRIDWMRGVTEMIGDNETDENQYGCEPRPVDFVTGCALLVRMSAVKQAGMLDARFFMYYEETEWCVRVSQHGYRILYVPEAKVWHKISQQAREASPRVVYYMTRNRLLFLKLSRTGMRAWAATWLEYARTLVSWTVRRRWRGKTQQRRAMLQAIRDYRRQHFGKVDLAGQA